MSRIARLLLSFLLLVTPSMAFGGRCPMPREDGIQATGCTCCTGACTCPMARQSAPRTQDGASSVGECPGSHRAPASDLGSMTPAKVFKDGLLPAPGFCLHPAAPAPGLEATPALAPLAPDRALPAAADQESFLLFCSFLL